MLHRLLLLATLATHTSAQFTTRYVLRAAAQGCIGECALFVKGGFQWTPGTDFPNPSVYNDFITDPHTLCVEGAYRTGTGTDITFPLSAFLAANGGTRADWLTADAPADETDACALMPYWDVSQVTDFSALFALAGGFNVDLSRWDVSAGTTFENMFLYADTFAQDLNLWAVQQTASIQTMFAQTGRDAENRIIPVTSSTIRPLCSEAWLQNRVYQYENSNGDNSWFPYAPYGTLCAMTEAVALSSAWSDAAATPACPVNLAANYDANLDGEAIAGNCYPHPHGDYLDENSCATPVYIYTGEADRTWFDMTQNGFTAQTAESFTQSWVPVVGPLLAAGLTLPALFSHVEMSEPSSFVILAHDANNYLGDMGGWTVVCNVERAQAAALASSNSNVLAQTVAAKSLARSDGGRAAMTAVLAQTDEGLKAMKDAYNPHCPGRL